MAAKLSAYTLAADSTAPRDPKRRGDHYRAFLVDAHRTIETLQGKIKELETERDKAYREKEYALSLCVTRTAAEEARLAAFRLAQEKAALLMEGPGGILNEASEAIRAMPDPRPKFTR
ncbi:hypothetical protein [Sinorhizobium sp. KGO-5]|uniref:hypothetical protein n=1 Tax=Sinorhizobium sp. KGO-5 TaxID=1470810 RepID=UPI0030C74931